jgi:hypothetical protein
MSYIPIGLAGLWLFIPFSGVTINSLPLLRISSHFNWIVETIKGQQGEDKMQRTTRHHRPHRYG